MTRASPRRCLVARAATVACVAALLAACSPTVKLQAPDEPIRFDVNVNITQEVRIKVDQELQEAFAANPALFGLTVPQQTPEN